MPSSSETTAVWRLAICAGVIVCNGIAVHSLAGSNKNLASLPAASFPEAVGRWRMADEGLLDAETVRILRPDLTVVRSYEGTDSSERAALFIAYYGAQSSGNAVHSPRNCLPGAGWEPTSSRIVQIATADSAEFPVNEFVVAKGSDRVVILYWYQRGAQVIPNEYASRLATLRDRIRSGRTDLAFVRIAVPLDSGQDDRGRHAAHALAAEIYPAVAQWVPK